MNKRLAGRRGYALVLVLLFNVLFLMLLGVAWRRMASVLRVATVATQQIQADEGSLRVLADVMWLLETGTPPASPYEAGATINLATSGEQRFYCVRFVQDAVDPTYWAVTVTRSDTAVTPSLPSHF